MKDKIKQLIIEQEKSIQEIEDWCGDDFNPCDASGGNFDDAYELGREHGIEEGKFLILQQLLELC